MKRIKIATVAFVIAAAGFGASLGAKALPMSEAQQGCLGGGGHLWEEWIDFIELEDGSFEGVWYATCTVFGGPDGYDYIEYYTNGEFVIGCLDSPTPRCEKPAPEPTPTPSPTSPTSTTRGGTSGSVQSTPPTVSPTTTTTGTTSGTASR
jgi:hypothetical protein